MPLLTLLAFSMLREGIEDWVRYKSDKATNSRPVSVYKNGVFAQIRSDAIEVGDIVLIKANEEFPADLILMSSSNPDGSCFISTSSLDGEKNLKKRKQAKGMNKFISNAMINEDEFIFVGEVLSQHPSKDLYNFAGTLTISGSVIPLDIN
jgi:P-type E1-E2 ATPase